MASPETIEYVSVVISVPRGRASLEKLLERVEVERRSLVIEDGGRPKAVLLSLRDYVRLAAPESEVLRIIGEESKKRGTNKLSSRQIDALVQEYRAGKKKH